MLLLMDIYIREGNMIRGKRLATSVLMIVLLTSFIGARDVFDIGLKVVTLYDADAGVRDSTFFEGMSDGYHWSVGVGLESRLSFIHLAFMMTSHEDSSDIDGMNLYTSALIDIPVVNDFLYLTIGGGLSNTIYLPQNEGEKLRYGREEIKEIDSFREMVVESPIHLKAGLDIMMGPAVLSLFYLRESSGTFGDSFESILASNGINKVGAGLTLSMY